MSIVLIQTATSPNAAYTRLLYTVKDSVYTTQPQFQYVLDVYEGSTLLKRMTQGINPEGSATFDVSRIIQGELEADYNWKISTLTPFNSSSKEFSIRAGEQFGTSISSSVTVYPDQATGSLATFQGVVEPNAGTYNFIATQQVLSNMPTTMSMQSDDYGTISIYNDEGTYISQSFYSASSTSGTYDLVDQKNYSTSGTYFNAVPISSSANYWNYVDVSISSSFGTENYRYEASDEIHREKIRFAFVNKLGAWDYYNNYNPVRQRINVTRQEYTAPRVDYSSRLSTYDISRRGKTVNDSTTDDQFTTDTDYLDKTTANWLEELIESPEVYIQRNGEFIPVVITDSNYTAKTSAGRQKLFKYTINFKPSNQPFGTWIPEYVQCPKQPSVSAFDPTLDGELSPYFWYDFSDTGSMIAYGTGSNEYQGITSKGTNTGSLLKGTDSLPKYDPSTEGGWTPFIAKTNYAVFNSGSTNNDNTSAGKNSTIARKYGTGDYKNDNIFYTGSTFTAISITQPNFNRKYRFNSDKIPLISVKYDNSAAQIDKAEEISFFGSGINGSISTGSNEVDFISTDTTNFTSMSYFEYEAPKAGDVNERDYAIYSYNGTAGGWQSSYQVYNSGSNNSLKVGREPISSSQNFVTASAIFNDPDAVSINPEGLAIGSRATQYTTSNPSLVWTTNPYVFSIAQFVMYDGILTNEQIQRVIDNYSNSTNSIAFNTFEN